MLCDLCLAFKEVSKGNPQANVVVHEAVYAVKENGVLLSVCPECMAWFYGMHETVLLPADTYVPEEEEIVVEEVPA